MTSLRLGLSGRHSRKDTGNALRAFPGIPLKSTAGIPPKPYNSRHLKPPEHFQNSLPLSTAGDASFFRSGCGEGLSELPTEFPAALRVFLREGGIWEAVNTWGKSQRKRDFPTPNLPRTLESMCRSTSREAGKKPSFFPFWGSGASTQCHCIHTFHLFFQGNGMP